MTSFTEALRAKYATDGEEDTLVQEWMSNCGLDKLPSVTMPRQGIRSSGSWEGINLAKMVEVSLPGNELQLPAVVDIISHLPRLGLLDVAGNPLGTSSDAWQVPAGPKGGFATLHTLVLAGTGVSWAQAGSLLQHLPALRELSLAKNGLTTIELPACMMNQVRCLRLEDNGIERWCEVQQLAASHSLTTLVLSNNPIQHVQIWPVSTPEAHEHAALPPLERGEGACTATEDGTSTVVDVGGPPATATANDAPFPALRSLWLSGTRLSSFDDVTQLGRLPSLRDVRLRELPLVAALEEDVARMLLISYLPNVAAGGKGLQTVGSETAGLLNGSAVTRSERWDAASFRERWDSGEWRAFRAATNPDKVPIARNPAQDVVKALTRLG